MRTPQAPLNKHIYRAAYFIMGFALVALLMPVVSRAEMVPSSSSPVGAPSANSCITADDYNQVYAAFSRVQDVLTQHAAGIGAELSTARFEVNAYSARLRRQSALARKNADYYSNHTPTYNADIGLCSVSENSAHGPQSLPEDGMCEPTNPGGSHIEAALDRTTRHLQYWRSRHRRLLAVADGIALSHASMGSTLNAHRNGDHRTRTVRVVMAMRRSLLNLKSNFSRDIPGLGHVAQVALAVSYRRIVQVGPQRHCSQPEAVVDADTELASDTETAPEADQNTATDYVLEATSAL